MTKCHTLKVGRKFPTSGQLTLEESAIVHLIYRYRLKIITRYKGFVLKKTLDLRRARPLSAVLSWPT